MKSNEYKSSLENQAIFCENLMGSLRKSVGMWVSNGCPDWCGIGQKGIGATKTEIDNDIVRLRRELNILHKMVS